MWRWSVAMAVLAATANAKENAQPLAKFDLKAGETVVFLGDSITHQCLYTQYVEDYYYTRFPKLRVQFHNSGVGGDRCKDALNRFEKDVAAFKPKYVTVLLGMNDGTYQPFDQKVFDTYETDMKEVIASVERLGATPILMTPTMYDSQAARLKNRAKEPNATYYNGVLAYFGARLQELAFTEGYGFVNMYHPLNEVTLDQRVKNPKFTLIEDAVHPGADGQVVMAYAILDQLAPSRSVSLVTVQAGPGHPTTVKATGGQVTDVNGMSFTFQANALPWVLPEEAKLGYQLCVCGHRLSQEKLRWQGLAPGKYELTIDNTPVGTFDASALSVGIELQGNEKSPQYQQALKVALLNKEKNDKATRPYRDLWRDVKIHRRAQDLVKQRPDDQTAAKQLEALIAKLQNLDAELQRLLQLKKEFEDRIYTENQPAPHRFTLRPVQ